MMARLSQELQEMRKLDVDDLLTIVMVCEGRSFSEIAGVLCVTAPAIHHRANKIRRIWGEEVVFPSSKFKTELSPFLREKGKRARAVLDELNSCFKDKVAA